MPVWEAVISQHFEPLNYMCGMNISNEYIWYGQEIKIVVLSGVVPAHPSSSIFPTMEIQAVQRCRTVFVAKPSIPAAGQGRSDVQHRMRAPRQELRNPPSAPSKTPTSSASRLPETVVAVSRLPRPLIPVAETKHGYPALHFGNLEGDVEVNSLFRSLASIVS